MKKILLFLVFLVVTTNIYAWKPTGFIAGAGYTVNFNRISDYVDFNDIGYPYLVSLDNYTFQGFFVELGQEYKIAEHSSIIGMLRFVDVTANREVLYDKYSDLYRIDPSGRTIKTAVKQYLEIPVLYQHKFFLNDKLSAFVSGGPAFSYWLTYKEIYGCTPDKPVTRFSKGHGFNRFNCLLSASAGIDFSGAKLFIRYNQSLIGFTNIKFQKSSYGMLQFGLSYTF